MDDRNRRRHPRARLLGVAVELHDAPAVTAVIDVSLGGVLVEVAAPIALSTTLAVTLRTAAGEVRRQARVVRVRWAGRDRGARLPIAVALMFDDNTPEATDRLAALLA